MQTWLRQISTKMIKKVKQEQVCSQAAYSLLFHFFDSVHNILEGLHIWVDCYSIPCSVSNNGQRELLTTGMAKETTFIVTYSTDSR